MYNKKLYTWQKKGTKLIGVAQDVWDSWIAHWSTLKWTAKSRIIAQNLRSETNGPGIGLSKHIGGSRSTVEHGLKMVLHSTFYFIN